MTKLRAAVIAMFGTVCAGSAVAGPKAPQCVPSDVSDMKLFNVSGQAVVCWDDKSDCIQLDDLKVVKRPSAPTAAATVRDDNGKPSACNAKTCKALGKKLASRLSSAGPDARVSVTSDLGMVAINADPNHELWNVADDKQLTPKAPAVFQKSEHPDLMFVEAVGALAFASWSPGGPFGKEIVVLPDGGNHSKAFDSGDTVVLDNGLYAVMGPSGLQVLDKTGRHSGKLDLKMSPGTDGSQPTMIGIGGNEVVVLGAYDVDKNERSVAHATISSDGKAKAGKTSKIPPCAN